MNESILFSLILIPAAASVLIACLPRKLSAFVAVIGAFLHAGFAYFLGRLTLKVTLPWAGFGLDFSLRMFHFAGWVLLAVSFFSVVVAVYAWGSLSDPASRKRFYAYLHLSLGCVSGALLADNLALVLFFWEGLLITLFAMISLGGKSSFKTAVKALIIVGVADFCLMGGIALAAFHAGTLEMSGMRLPLDSIGTAAFILLMIGAIAKAGSMPFHTWIPDAAHDAPLVFMAFFPAAAEKLLGIYFLARITIDLFALSPASALSGLLMWIGAATIFLAVMMALIQKDYKKLLSYHAISQVGYMILGIGTCVPIGIAGGLFHMVNHTMYKCGLFLTAGAVERQTGTTDLGRLGGLGRKMPITFGCFIVCALSICGAWPFNGFFSKELVYEAARERNIFLYGIAAAGSLLTAASFLKLGHAAFLGPRQPSRERLREAPFVMLLPMLTLAGFCVLLGVDHNFWLMKFVAPVANQVSTEHVFSGFRLDAGLTAVTVLILAAAVIHHVISARRSGSGLKAADHIHDAPVLAPLYAAAEKGFFDPYRWGKVIVIIVSVFGVLIDRITDAIYRVLGFCSVGASVTVRWLHSGYYVTYIIWSLVGSAVLLWYLLKGAGS